MPMRRYDNPMRMISRGEKCPVQGVVSGVVPGKIGLMPVRESSLLA
jgi:hypothetical protein